MTASLQAVVGTYSALVQEGNSWRADCAECGAQSKPVQGVDF